MSIAIPNTAAPAATAPTSRWFQNPWADLLIGAGAWSIPLLFLTHFLNEMGTVHLAIAFYAITIFCNYPHYMATIYRAYGTRQDFNKYRFFTIYLTSLLLLTVGLIHMSQTEIWNRWFPNSRGLLPFFFTFYITWSPWHYTGQNFGLTMMFARRNGAKPSRATRNLLYGAFAASYLMWILTLHFGMSHHPYIVPIGTYLGVPNDAAQTFLTIWKPLMMVVFFLCGGAAAVALVRQTSLRAMFPALLLFFTQLVWFVLPNLLELLITDFTVPPVYYATGILAFMHCAQYLWITSYYTKREAQTGQRPAWNPRTYYATLIFGGIFLFVPGPWLVSTVFRFDLFESILIFQSLVNMHHFMIDGAIWKLRDGRIAQLLIGQPGPQSSKEEDAIAASLTRVASWLFGPTGIARVLRWGGAVALLAFAGVDQYYNAITAGEPPLERITVAEKLAPHSSRTHFLRAQYYAKLELYEQAQQELLRAISINPNNVAASRLLGTIHGKMGNFEEAYQHFRALDMRVSPDVGTLVNWGIVAAALGKHDEALKKFELAEDVDPNQTDTYIYSAELQAQASNLDRAEAYIHAYLRITGAEETAADLALETRIIVTLFRLADAYALQGKRDEAWVRFKYAYDRAEKARLFGLAGQGSIRLGELASTDGRHEDALNFFRRGLSHGMTANQSGYPQDLAWAFFHYAQYLQSRSANPAMIHALYSEAELLLLPFAGTPYESPLLGEASRMRVQLERRHGITAIPPDQERRELIGRALNPEGADLQKILGTTSGG